MDRPLCQHSIACCFEVTGAVLQTVFKELFEARVVLEGMILKPNRVIDGKDARKAGVEEVAERLFVCLNKLYLPLFLRIAFLVLRAVRSGSNGAFFCPIYSRSMLWAHCLGN
ncbi:fructose-bisphosphate aldolase [Bartonella tribocorum]|uniref:Fructose-bisphosphate aldolase n=1 Tax=Bartonella tribocorum (strain DSM 28219 / CCUG 45778 / CIP 105476 / IBS 506) TaxID=382640 RepID=A9IYR1_BART1|nr:fructose-bisphosphate aldolase [Bartonella tribocorum CIP 105476]CDO49746.1 fructose-bisphosphate aldolase [Bartonella tribocorum]